MRFRGEHYTVSGAKPGPAPAHRVGLWVGAYGPRMLRLAGRRGDGWLPSVGEHYMAVEDIASRQATVPCAPGHTRIRTQPSRLARA